MLFIPPNLSIITSLYIIIVDVDSALLHKVVIYKYRAIIICNRDRRTLPG